MDEKCESHPRSQPHYHPGSEETSAPHRARAGHRRLAQLLGAVAESPRRAALRARRRAMADRAWLLVLDARRVRLGTVRRVRAHGSALLSISTRVLLVARIGGAFLGTGTVPDS